MARTIEEAKKSGRKICRAIPLFLFYFFSRGKEVNGGERGIRTLGTVTRTTIFETVAFDHSAISPAVTFLNIVRLFQNAKVFSEKINFFCSNRLFRDFNFESSNFFIAITDFPGYIITVIKRKFLQYE